MKLPEKVSTIVVGNPLIADVAVQSGGLVVVTGKGYGSTNLIVLDRTGSVLMERSIVVRGPSQQYRRGLSRHGARDLQLHAALRAPHHARRFRPSIFTATLGQSDVRNSQSSARRQPRASSAATGSRRRTCCSRSWLAKRERAADAVVSIAATIRQRDFAKDQPDQAYRLTAVQRASRSHRGSRVMIQAIRAGLAAGTRRLAPAIPAAHQDGAPLRARSGRHRGGRVRHRGGAVPRADVRHHGDRDRLLRRARRWRPRSRIRRA